MSLWGRQDNPTFGSLLAQGRDMTVGFDYLRVGLALAVLLLHAIAICGGTANDWIETHALAEKHIILPAFFALSGYLVAGSLFRNSTPQFVALRVIRIFPALAFEVLLTAIILGSICTTLPLRQYWTDPEFVRYLMNVFGIIHFTLPGVFEGKFVNAQLWTIPYELECYILLVVLAMIGLIKRPRLFVIAAAMITVFCVLMVPADAALATNVLGRTLVLSFIYGVAIYLNRDSIPASALLFALSMGFSLALLGCVRTELIAAAPIAYGTIYIGIKKLPKIPFGDLSYGIYLFHFPVAQSTREFFGHNISWPMLFIVTLIVSGLLAMTSWKLIEEPIMNRKKKVTDKVAVFERTIEGKMQSTSSLKYLWRIVTRPPIAITSPDEPKQG